jgi:hypothetical protein
MALAVLTKKVVWNETSKSVKQRDWDPWALQPWCFLTWRWSYVSRSPLWFETVYSLYLTWSRSLRKQHAVECLCFTLVFTLDCVAGQESWLLLLPMVIREPHIASQNSKVEIGFQWEDQNSKIEVWYHFCFLTVMQYCIPTVRYVGIIWVLLGQIWDGVWEFAYQTSSWQKCCSVFHIFFLTCFIERVHIFKMYHLVVYIISRVCTQLTVPQSSCRTSSSLPKENPFSFALCFPYLWQPLICLPLKHTCLFWTFHINEMTQYGGFCVLLLSQYVFRYFFI